MTTQLSSIAGAYVESVNNHDRAAFNALFANDAVVNDAGREFRSQAEIQSWSDREIFDAQVTLDVVRVHDRDGQTVITTKVDGNFDRTGLPDPVVIDQIISANAGKIVSLTCELSDAESAKGL